MRLFLDRAGAVQPTFRLDADNAAAVASICRRLDGIPLALELAAARTRALSVQAIAERLKDRFRLLVSGDQTVLPRQRTLRALIDWSFELLSEPERTLFRRLAVFAGGWTLDSAEAVCAGEGLDSVAVLDLLAQLVQKSLVVMERDGARYRMLETVRAYAAEKLAEAGDEAATRRRHVEHYVEFADRMRGKLAGPEQASGLAELDLERDNLLAAHGWCGMDATCLEPGLNLVFLLKIYWHARGLLSLGWRVTVEALARTRPDQRDFLRCRALCDAGQLAYRTGRYDEAHAHLSESHAIALELGAKDRLSAVLPPLGLVLVAMGQLREATSIYEEAVRLAHELGRDRQRAVAINSLAQLHRTQGDLAKAEQLYMEALAVLCAMGDQESVSIARLNLAMLAVLRDGPAEASRWLRQVVEENRSLDSRPVLKSLLEVAAGLCVAKSRFSEGARLYGAAERMSEQTGIRREPEDESFLQPLMARAAQALGRAAFDELEGQGRRSEQAEVLSWLGAAIEADG